MDLKDDSETLQKVQDDMINDLIEKEKEYNKTMARLIMDIDILEHNHTTHLDDFEDHELDHNKTISILEQILNMGNISEKLQGKSMQSLALKLNSNNKGASLLQGAEKMYIVLFMLNLYFC